MSAWSPTYSQVVSRDETIAYVGGIRARFVYDSIYDVLKSALGALGWFSPTKYDTPPGTRKNRPVTLLAKQLDWGQKVELNTIAFVPESTRPEYAEIGSQFQEYHTVFYLDIFGESEAVSLQLALDIIDILQGKFPAAGRGNGPTLDVLDLSQSGHYKIGYVLIQQPTSNRSPVFEQPWQQFLRVVRFEASDWYGESEDLAVGRAHWSFTP